MTDTKNAFGKALKQARQARGLSQEDFGIVSSRTYISSLERALKSPTLEKIDELAAFMNLHPLALITLAYLESPNRATLDQLLEQVRSELDGIIP